MAIIQVCIYGGSASTSPAPSPAVHSPPDFSVLFWFARVRDKLRAKFIHYLCSFTINKFQPHGLIRVCAYGWASERQSTLTAQVGKYIRDRRGEQEEEEEEEVERSQAI